MYPEEKPTRSECPSVLSDGSAIEEAATPLSERKRRMAVSESDVLPALLSPTNAIDASRIDDYREDRTPGEPPLDYALSRAQMPTLPITPTRKSGALRSGDQNATAQLKGCAPSDSLSESNEPAAVRGRATSRKATIVKDPGDLEPKSHGEVKATDDQEQSDSEKTTRPVDMVPKPRRFSRTRCWLSPANPGIRK